MRASFDWRGLEAVAAGVKRSAAGDLERALVEELHTAAPGLRAGITSRARTRLQRTAVGTVSVRTTSTGIEATGGRGGGGLGAVVWAGAEYGGRKSRRVTYAARSPRGRPYVIRRRTTMQFLPHLGREGYFFWPAVRDLMPKIEAGAGEVVERVLGGGR